MLKRICNAEPTIGNECPHKSICKLALEFESYKTTSIYNRSVSNVSSYYCSTTNWSKFEENDPMDKTKLEVLSNGMIVRCTGKHKTKDFDVYRIVLPEAGKPLLFDGYSFFTVDNITNLEPQNELDGVYIKSKGEINV